MTERGAHLVDHVLPRAPVRQWVLSLPFELRYRLAWDRRLGRAVLAVYTRALQGFYRKRAKASGHQFGRTGTVTVIQRFGGALNLNVHFHTLAVDGVFMRQPNGSLSFAAANTPTDEEVEALLGVIRARVLRLLVRRGLLGVMITAPAVRVRPTTLVRRPNGQPEEDPTQGERLLGSADVSSMPLAGGLG
jgi:hypothetical protein